MTLAGALTAYILAIGLLTLTPGLDTMLVLRAAALEGRRAAWLAAAGIGLGCLAWGIAVSVGLDVLLAASARVYAALTWCGAAYLVWTGLTLLIRPRRTIVAADGAELPSTGGALWLRRGLLTNLLNPKIGVFYVTFLPQFVPAGYAPGPFVLGLALGHVALGLCWLTALGAGAARLGPLLRRSALVAGLDRLAGLVFVGFGLRLAAERLR